MKPKKDDQIFLVPFEGRRRPQYCKVIWKHASVGSGLVWFWDCMPGSWAA